MKTNGTQIVFGIDDLNPMKSTDGLDYGGDLGKGILGPLESIQQDYPFVKITFFMPTHFHYLNPGIMLRGIKKGFTAAGLNKWIPSPIRFQTSLEKHSDFIQYLKKHKNWDIQMHGVTHFNSTNWSSQEFLNASTDDAKSKLTIMKKSFSLAGLPKPTILCPPGWGISEGLLNVCQQENITLAGSFHDASRVSPTDQSTTGLVKASATKMEKIKGVWNIPRNWSIYQTPIQKAEQILSMNGKRILGVHAHCQNVGVKNGINVQNMEHLRRFCDFVEQNQLQKNWVQMRDLIHE